jgi:hypothetical protein
VSASEPAATAPVLSVVVVIVSDTLRARAHAGHLAGCLKALREQRDAPAMEVVVPHVPDTQGIEAVAREFNEVRFLAVDDSSVAVRTAGSREHHDVLRARGLAVARGELVALLEDHARPEAHWCANIVSAHRQDPAAAIGGAIDNGVDRPLAWAVYYCDFGRYQNPIPAGPSSFASDANTAYKRSALESVRPLWDDSFREGVVNGALLAAGETLTLRRDIIVYQQRSDLSLGDALAERYVWGRSYALTRSTLISSSKRVIYALASPLLPAVLFLRMAVNAWKRRRLASFMAAAPLIALLTLSWSAGECAGYLAGAHPKAQRAGS